MEDPVIRIPPYHYVHVLDLNSNVTRVEVGPHTYIRQDHERWALWGRETCMRWGVSFLHLAAPKDVDAMAGEGGCGMGVPRCGWQDYKTLVLWDGGDLCSYRVIWIYRAVTDV